MTCERISSCVGLEGSKVSPDEQQRLIEVNFVPGGARVHRVVLGPAPVGARQQEVV